MSPRVISGRGYGYVGVSRFRNRVGLYLFGRPWRSDFLLAGEGEMEEVIERGMLSESSDEDEDCPRTSWGSPLAGLMHGSEDESETPQGSVGCLPVLGGGLDIDVESFPVVDWCRKSGTVTCMCIRSTNGMK